MAALLAAITSYQSLCFAWLMSHRMGTDSADMLASTLVDAQIQLVCLLDRDTLGISFRSPTRSDEARPSLMGVIDPTWVGQRTGIVMASLQAMKSL